MLKLLIIAALIYFSYKVLTSNRLGEGGKKDDKGESSDYADYEEID